MPGSGATAHNYAEGPTNVEPSLFRGAVAPSLARMSFTAIVPPPASRGRRLAWRGATLELVPMGEVTVRRAPSVLLSLVSAGLVSSLKAQAIPPKAEQITAAVLPLAEGARATAKVFGYDEGGNFVVLRDGRGMHCLAQYPKEKQFHVSCYHESLEPFMARGRELRASGTAPGQVDTVRFAEAKSGKLKLPGGPAALYQLIGGTWDPTAGVVNGARRLYVVYIPYATGASTGLAERPKGTEPWIMFPGTPKAHIMFTPDM